MLGDKSDPFRCSKLAALVKCSMRVYLLSIVEAADNAAREAAETGSLTHAGVAAFHTTHGDLKIREKAAWDAIAAARSKFPQADVNEVRLNITPYMADPRNITAKLLAVEFPLDFTLPPHSLDPTKKPIYVQGTLDQLRFVNGQAELWDLKTGRKTGWEYIHDHAIQLCAYCYGVRDVAAQIAAGKRESFPDWEKWQTCQPGKLILTMGYRRRGIDSPSPDGVYWPIPVKWQGVADILENVRLHVALYRMGEIQYGPGPHCTYCEFGGLPGCQKEYQTLHKRK